MYKKLIWIGLLGTGFILLQTEFKVFSKILRSILFREKLVLNSTPSTIKSIQLIDELITAEFCGEVYASLEEVIIVDAEAEWEIKEKELKKLFSNIQNALIGLEKSGFETPRKRRKKFYNEKRLSFLRNDPSYKDLMKMTGVSSKEARLQEIKRHSWENFKGEKYREEKRIFIESRLSNANLIYIARGCVQAGIQLSSLKDSLIGDSILILSLSGVDIVDPIINPWFVPGKISGFEVWEQNKDAKKLSFEEIKKVKALCKEKLLEEAISSGIKERAIANAENSLLALVKSIEKDITKVTLIYPHVEAFVEKILIDSVLDVYEFATYEDHVDQLLASLDVDTEGEEVKEYKLSLKEATVVFSDFCERIGGCPGEYESKFEKVLSLD